MGDICSPVKNHDPETSNAIKRLERIYEDKLLNTLDGLPIGLKAMLTPLIKQDKTEHHAILAKYADYIHALYEADKEVRLGNYEFECALESQKKILARLCEESEVVNYFMKEFYPAFTYNIDQLVR
jgi:5'-deoxynucleotidase